MHSCISKLIIGVCIQLTSGIEKAHILEPKCSFISPKPGDLTSFGRRRSLVNEQSEELSILNRHFLQLAVVCVNSLFSSSLINSYNLSV